ncbi:MAG: metal ABC transporter substrate-binding protein [Chloroflexota bacterium]
MHPISPRTISRRAVLTAPLLAIMPSVAITAQSRPLQLVATTSVVGDLVAAVAGDLADVTTIVGAGVDAHTFSASAQDAIAIDDADLLFQIGLGFEPWLDELLEGDDHAVPIITLTDDLPLRSLTEDGASHVSDDGHGHGDHDPHVWHDVQNAILMTEAIRDALVAADPANAEAYTANADAAIAELEILDAWVVEQVATLPPERRKLVTAHDTFGYFADRYGFEIVGTALGITTEQGEPSAAEIVALVDEIRAAGVPAIFVENVQNPALMESIAAEAGVAIAPPLYSDALGAPGTPGEHYDGMMRSNVETIGTAWGS